MPFVLSSISNIELCSDLIQELDFIEQEEQENVNSAMNLNLKKAQEIEQILYQMSVSIKEHNSSIKKDDEKKCRFLTFHYHYLCSLYFKKLEIEEQSKPHRVLASNLLYDAINRKKRCSHSENFVNLEKSNQNNLICGTEEEFYKNVEFIFRNRKNQFKDEFNKFKKTIKNMNEYVIHHSLKTTLFELLNDTHIHVSKDKNLNEQSSRNLLEKIENSRCYIQESSETIILEFLHQIRNANDFDLRIIFFGEYVISCEIDRLFRKYSIYFHPDKHRDSHYSKVYNDVFVILCQTKIKLQQDSYNDETNKSYENLFKEGQEKMKTGLYYHYAFQQKFNNSQINDDDDLYLLKTLSITNFKDSYYLFSSACKIADLGSQFQEMLECRLKMAASLFVSNLFLEASLTAYSALYLTRNSNLKSHYNEYQIQKSLKIINLINQNDIEGIIFQFLKHKNDKNTKNEYSKLSSPTHDALVLKVNSTMVQLKANKVEIERKISSHTIRQVSAAISGISIASSYILMFPPNLIVGMIGVTSGAYFLQNKSNSSNKEELAIVNKLENILNDAVEAHSKSDHKKFFENLSVKYNRELSLIYFNISFLEINYQKIEEVLLKYGFRPDCIAYILLMISDMILSLKNSLPMENIYRNNYELKAVEILQRITKNCSLEIEARKLDKELNESRKKLLLRNPVFFGCFSYDKRYRWWNRMDLHFGGNSARDSQNYDLLEEDDETSFFSRFNEIRMLASLNLFFMNLLREVDQDTTALKNSLLNVQLFLNMEYKYVTNIHIRFEALRDFIWLFNFNKDLVDLIYCTTKKIKEKVENPDCDIMTEVKQINDLENSVNKISFTNRPVERIIIFSKIKKIYKQIFEKTNNMEDTLNPIFKKNIFFGFAKCLLNLSEFTKTYIFLTTHQDCLDKEAEFWCILGNIEMKKWFNYENALHWINKAKTLDHKNTYILEEAKKIENLTKLNTKNYLESLKSPNQSRKKLKVNHSMKRIIEKKYRILSVDGGGIRGIIPAIILNEIEMEMRKPISSVFDMMAGTSTGAIIVSALSIPKKGNSREPLYTAGDIVDLYYKESRSIFETSNLFDKYLLPLCRKFTKYKDNGRDALFKKYFRSYTISDSLTDILIPSVSENMRLKTYYFTNFKAMKEKAENFTFHQVLMAATAAPSYFYPYEIPGLGPLLDGGITMNNPAEAAYFEAKRIYPEVSDVSILSLGTSSFIPGSYDFKKSSNIAYWGLNFVDYVLPPDQGDVDSQISQLLDNKYMRWQIFTENEIKLDAFDKETLNNLVELARQYIQELKDDDNNTFYKTIEWLKNE